MSCKAVILAAGKGARLAPLTTAIPKELLPVFGLPAIHHVVYELAEAGISEIMIVLSQGKEGIGTYFSERSTPKGEIAERLSARKDALLSRVELRYAFQLEPRGTGDAILLAKDFADEEGLVVAYPDDLRRFDADVPQRRREEPFFRSSERGFSSLLVRRVLGRNAGQYGVVFPRREEGKRPWFEVSRIEEKPVDYSADTACVLFGRIRLTKDCLRSIEERPLSDREGVIPALNAMAAKGKLRACLTQEETYDVGTHEGYADTLRRLMRKQRRKYERERTLSNMPS